MKKRIGFILFAIFSLNCISCTTVIPTPQPTPEPGPIDPPETRYLNVEIYASNDFHGQVEEEGNSIGLANYGTFMKKMGEKENTLLLDQGDTWQGSIYSNYNRGALINDVMSCAKFDSRTVGNHDFDWGVEAVKQNTAREYNGYTIPVLAANVYDYDFANKVEGNIQQSDIGQKTISYTLENGLKVGIVGVIGTDVLSSITSVNVKDICFKSDVATIKEEATKLRNEGCNIVIASVHAGQGTLLGNSLDKYVDLVLCGHTHRYEITKEGNVSYAQFGSYGQYIGHINLTYDTVEKKVSNTAIKRLGRTEIKNTVNVIDSEIQNIIDRYNSECKAEADVVLASRAEYFSKEEEAVNLMCKAIYDECVKEGYEDVVLSYCNTARKNLNSPIWTYADLYEAFPFDNVVYIAEVLGSDLLYEVQNYNNIYYNPSFNYEINPTSYYKIACIDFLLFHTNADREFNYFNNFSGEPLGQLNKNYRLILRDWLLSNGYNNDKLLAASDFSSSLDCFNRSLLREVFD